ncbi:MAG: DUF4347 domain-containing protein, partial [Alphaproteobacteria bacterium]|nr:DUF4347 domain-containing protein [Alphaproteobacteria bacterium]
MALEPRMMFDGAGAVEAASGIADGAADPTPDSLADTASAPPALPERKEVAFVDSNVAEWRTLAAGIGPGVEVVVLDGLGDGLAQVAEWAQTHSGYDAIHVVSHGAEGMLRLGTATLTAAGLSDPAAQGDLARIGEALTPDGDILFYGCAVGADGAFVARIAEITGADIAASTDATGAADLGGDWELETASGPVETPALVSDGFDALLATPTLDSTKSPTLAGINMNLAAPTNASTANATLVSALVNTTGIANFSDTDGDQPGIAITGLNTNGQLYYSTNGGTAWTAVNWTLSDTAALMLYADASTYLYFKPAANYSGTLANALTFRTWDRSGPANGTTQVNTQGFSVGLTGSYDTELAYGVAVSGNYAYVADDRAGLRVIDISNPVSPSLLGTYDTPGYASGVVVNGTYAYVADLNRGLQVINISNPASPSLAGSYGTSGNTFSVAVSGNYAYVADASSGLRVINISNPASPSLVTTYDTSGSARGVVISGNYVYVADDTEGLRVIRAAPNSVSTTTDTAAITVTDNVPPTVTGVSSTTVNDSYKVGDYIAVTVTFNEAVTVTGVPSLTLETGTTDRTATYSSGSGTSTLTFTYTVQAGDSSADLDYAATTALALSGGTIRDAAGNNATLTLPTPGATGSLGLNKSILVDGVAPAVTNVSASTSNGTYKMGDQIAVTVVFGEVVTVAGTPTLTLETGTTDRAATYSSGSGSKTLTFTYTVQAGDVSADLSYLSTSALALSGSTIKDAAGNNATLTLAALGAAGSLNANKAIVIDGVAPTATSFSPTDGASTVAVGTNVVLGFSEAVKAGTGNIILRPATGSDITVPVTDLSQVTFSNAGGTYTVTINPSADLAGGKTYTVLIGSGVITDLSGNSFAGLVTGASAYDFASAGEPTLTAFSGTAGTTTEDSGTPVTVTLNGLKTLGDEADPGGTVDAFVVRAVSSGSLTIGANAGAATAWAAGTNDTIDATHNAYWLPAANANGTLNAFTVVAKDNDGQVSASPVQVQASVTAAQDAPVLASSTTAAALTTIAEDVADGANTGTTVATLIADGRITDVDVTTAPEAIAISTATNTNGTWQYKIGSGSGAWTAFDFTTNAGKALLLDSTDNIRFVPTADTNGTLNNGITFYAWDKTTGAAGDYLTVSGNSGTDKTLSVDTGTASITVTAVNDAPVFLGGAAATAIGSGNELARGVVVQADGKILVAGESHNGQDNVFAVTRYTAYGAPDMSFGTNGTVQLDLRSSGTTALDDVPRTIALQSDGKILVAGYSQKIYNVGTGAIDYDFALIRLNADGSLDTTFSDDGKITTDKSSNFNDELLAVLTDGNGKVVVAGWGRQPGNTANFADFIVSRYDSNGLLDATFGTGGTTYTTFDSGTARSDEVTSVALQGDGKIVVAGGTQASGDPVKSFAVARYTTAGALDAGFDTDGQLTTIFYESATAVASIGRAVAVQSDGKIVVAGEVSFSGGNDFALARYNTDGSLDGTFGTGGKVTTAIGSGNDVIRAMVVDGSGRIVVSGYASNGSDNDFVVARYTSAGVLDASFGTGGKITTRIGTGADEAYAMKLQSDGKILIVGSTVNNNGNTDIALARYDSDGQVDRAFGHRLTTINEDVADSANSGTVVADLIAEGAFTDVDVTAGSVPQHMAVTAVDTTNGTWQFKALATDNAWTAIDFSGGNAGKALLLSQTSLVRFVPTANWNGIVTDGITFRAWDGSSGTAGAYLTIAGNAGGSGPLSSSGGTAGIQVLAVNDGPSVTAVSVPYTDSAAADTFAAATGNAHVGTLAYTDIESNTVGTWGIDGGAGVSHTADTVTYDVGKTGTYGTLYVKSTTGQYLFVPTAATMNTVPAGTTRTEAFTVTALDNGGATGRQSLTVQVT